MRRVGDYELGPELGRGVLGTVYQARDLRSGAEVALKLLNVGLTSEAAQRRFHTEIKTLTRLDHPNVVRVHEAGVDGGRPFLALELVRGRSLADRLAHGPLPITTAVRLAREVAGALQHAHAQQVLHRDVKPGNVLVGDQGQALLTDFGLAKDLDDSVSLSKTGQLSGTPGYLSPEQARGRRGEQGPATDVYGLGALLYALLTGRPPFAEATVVDTVTAIVEQEPTPPSRLRSGLDPALDRIVLRCLAKVPAERFADPGQVEQALVDWERGARTGTRVRPVVWVAAGLLALALLAAAAIVLRGSGTVPPDSPAARSPSPLASAPQVDSSAEPGLPAGGARPSPSPAASPAGGAAQVAEGEAPIRSLSIRSDGLALVVGHEDGHLAAFGLPRLHSMGSMSLGTDPQEMLLAWHVPLLAVASAGGGVRIVPLQKGESSYTQPTAQPVHGLCWTPDDRTLMFGAGERLGILSVADEAQRVRWVKAGNGSIHALAMAGASEPGHPRLAAITDAGAIDVYKLETASARWSQIRLGTHAGAKLVAISPSAALVASASGNRFAVYDVESVTLCCAVRLDHGPVHQLVFTPWGTLLVLFEQALCWVHPRSGVVLRTVQLQHPVESERTAVDPRGHRLVVVTARGGVRTYDLRDGRSFPPREPAPVAGDGQRAGQLQAEALQLASPAELGNGWTTRGDQALDKLEQALQADPSRESARELAARLYLMRGRPQDLERGWDVLKLLDPNTDPARGQLHALRYLFLRAQGKKFSWEAVGELERAVVHGGMPEPGQEAAARREWAEVLIWLGEARQALGLTRAALERIRQQGLDREEPLTQAWHGLAQLALGHNAEARDEILSAVRLGIGAPPFLRGLLAARMRLGALDETLNGAQRMLQVAQQGGTPPTRLLTVYAYLAAASWETRHYDLVEGYVRQTLDVAGGGLPMDVELYLELTLAKLQARTGHPAAGVEHLQRARGLDSAVGQGRRPDLLAHEAELELLEGDPDKASGELTRALQLRPSCQRLYALAARVALVRREPQLALTLTHLGLGLNPTLPELRVQGARAHLAQGDLDKAQAEVTLVLTQTRGNWASAQRLQAELALERGDGAAAGEALERAAALDPQDPELAALRGLQRLAQGDVEGARQASAQVEQRSLPREPRARAPRELARRLAER